MSNEQHDTTIPETIAPPRSAGATLRAAREAQGMSIDAAAQQLKLAPRQVQALEADDYAQLPGRTFVRGFMRNYARLLRLDADAVLATLPDVGHSPSLDRPSLSPTTRVMGELPADVHAKPSRAGGVIAVVVLAIVLIALAYEFGRPLADRARAILGGRTAAAPAPASAPAPVAVESPPPVAARAPTATDTIAPSAATTPTVEPPPAAAADGPLVFVFRGTSWIEVKDAKGALVLSTMGYPGATHAVGGAFPLEVVLGNAEAVIVSLRGAPLDTTAFVKQNVAKFTVK